MAQLEPFQPLPFPGSRDLTHLSQHSCPISGSSQAEFHSHGIFFATRQNVGEADASIYFQFNSFISLSTIPFKLKAKMVNDPKSSKKGKSAAKKRQHPPLHLTTEEEMWTTEDEEEPSLKAVVTLLVTMRGTMGAYEKRLY